MNKNKDNITKDKVIDYKTVLDGKLYTINNPDHLPICCFELPIHPCKHCFIADRYDSYGCMVYCCDLSHCIYDDIYD